MRILMLGWEFPPFISGGLGTACCGLTRALDQLGHEIIFVLPKPIDGSYSNHVRLLGPDDAANEQELAQVAEGETLIEQAVHERTTHSRVEFREVPAKFSSSYSGGAQVDDEVLTSLIHESVDVRSIELAALREAGIEAASLLEAEAPLRRGDSDYAGDIIADAHRYATLVLRLARRERFDVVHAHDWMTYPAGMAVARATGRPLVVHVHSTEFDRSGEHVNQRIYDIERRGMHAAVDVIAVSELTRSLCLHRYGVSFEKTHVCYNGVEADWAAPPQEARIAKGDKIVLFLGRITMQKGPEYFIASAKRVLEKMDAVKFIVAGSGDMARRMIEMAAQMGIGHKVLFTGFLRGADVRRIFQMADCYVMPSVSEPFGIAPLEAISHDTPVIISRQSGVSEVLTHALKVNFWDIDEMADKILAVLRHPPLSSVLREHGAYEVRKLRWEGAARKCAKVYEEAVESMPVFATAGGER